MNEIWLPVVGYEGLYDVSNTGRVRSLNYNHKMIIRDLAQCKDRYGYLHCMLFRRDIGAKYPTVHSLVAEAFLGRRSAGMTVNHKDENKTNNNIDNLEYLSAIDNANYGTAKQRAHKHKRKRIVRIDKDGTEVVFEGRNIAASASNCNPGAISQAISGRYKTAGGFKWRYVS